MRGVGKKVGMAGAGAVMLVATPFVADFEGLRTEAYLDPVGIATICYGSTEGVELGQQLSQLHCEKLLERELLIYLEAVQKYVTVEMPVTRTAALTSFAYNVGIGNFKRSTMLRKMNAGQTREACNELTRWVFARGIRLRGLVRRREAEKQMCLKGLDNGLSDT